MVTELFGGSGQHVADPVLDRLRLATLGSYDIAGELGRGGMAIVYVARDLKLARTVAIKVMDPRLALAQGMAERFLQEARIAARLQHPNIIVVHDIQHSEELIFFVMGLVEGGSLDELCGHGEPLPVEQARWVLLQAARSLAFAHSEGITHRDVKPANILINLKGDVILTDFGIAKAVGGDSMTKSGTQIGTPTYMSPEQFGNVAAGPASDQYALGVTAYRLLTGETPFTGDLYQLIAAHISNSPVHLRDVRPDCPAFLANAVMRMLQKKPEDRWPTLDDLIAVFGANMSVDGGPARKKLAMSAQALHRQRATSVAALTARAPLSPTPTNASPTRPVAPLPESMVVSISPPGATIFVRGTLQLKATVMHEESGEPSANARTVWSSGDPAVVTVSVDGTLEGVAPGTAIVRATAHGAFEEATIRVEPAPIARLTVTQPKITLRMGESVRPQVSAVDVNGVSRTEVSYVWVSRVPSVADIDTLGLIRAVAPGESIVEVSVGNMRRLIEVTVVRRPVASIRIQPTSRTMELGDARALRVNVIDDQGNAVSAPTIQWASSEPAAIYVDSAGTALAIGPGVSQITASSDDASDVVELESVEAPIGAIRLTLDDDHVEIGDAVAVNLHVSDTAGAPRSAAGITVWSSAPEVAGLDLAAMLVHGLAAGVAHIHAACDDRTSTVRDVQVTLRVTAPAVSSIHVTPASLELELGATAGIAVQYLDARGRALTHVNAIIDSAVTDVAVVDVNGAVRGVASGATELRVRVTNADGQTLETRVPVRVRKAGLARFAIKAPQQTLVVGEAFNLTVTAWDTLGQQIADVTPVWHSSPVTAATVGGTGRVSAVRAGSVVISAELGGRTEQLSLTVVAAPLTSLTIQPPAKELVVGVVTRLAVKAMDSNGATVQPTIRYSADPADAARLNGSELTPLRAGSFTVRAVVTDTSPAPTGVCEAMATLTARDADASEIASIAATGAKRPAPSSRWVLAAAGGIGALALAWVLWPSSNSEPTGPVNTTSAATTPATTPATTTATTTATAPATTPATTATVLSDKAVLVLDAKSLVLTLGDSAIIAARVDSAGSRVSGAERAVKWSSSDNARATVSATGVVRALRVGPTRVIATRGALRDTVTVNVAPRERQLTSMKIAAVGDALPIGVAQQLSVQFLDAQQLAMTRDLPTVRWSSSDAKTASVSPSGVVTVYAEKGATISATSGALVAKVAVRGKRGAVASPGPAVLTVQEELDAATQAFDRAPADRAVARTTRLKLDNLESLLSPSEQARAALYVGRAYATLDQKDDACRSLARAQSLRTTSSLVTQIEEVRRKTGCVVFEAPRPEPAAAAPGKRQSELKAELDSAVMRYTKAFESRDAARVRAAFPAIPKAKLDGYSSMFREAREIAVTVGGISAGSEALSETVGATVDVAVAVRVVFRPRSGDPTESRTEWKMRLQRTANGWLLIALN